MFLALGSLKRKMVGSVYFFGLQHDLAIIVIERREVTRKFGRGKDGFLTYDRLGLDCSMIRVFLLLYKTLNYNQRQKSENKRLLATYKAQGLDFY